MISNTLKNVGLLATGSLKINSSKDSPLQDNRVDRVSLNNRSSVSNSGYGAVQLSDRFKSPSSFQTRAFTGDSFLGKVKYTDVNLRSGPGTNYSIIGNLNGYKVGQTITFDGWDTGTPVYDKEAKANDNEWFRFGGNKWVASAFINGRHSLTVTPPPPPPTGGLQSNPSASNPLKGFKNPFKGGAGKSGGHDASYGQGFAKDFGSAAGATFGSSIYAMRGGTVVSWQDATTDRKTSLASIDDGRSGVTANYILVKLDDNDGVDNNYRQMYLHLQQGSIPASLKKSGARVNTGDKVGAVGYNGYAFGVHLHTEVNQQTGNNLWQRQTQPFQWD
jgi:Peptidase family M23